MGEEEKILEQKRDFLVANKHKISNEALKNYEDAFNVEYTHESTKMEGNTLTLRETKAILEDHISIGGKHLREIYEVVNHKQAFDYIKQCLLEDKDLSENSVKDIHAILMDKIITGGFYRNEDVRISGARHTPPSGNQMYEQIKWFYQSMIESQMTPIERVAYTHAEFVRIHPFIDGNGRTSRLMMNYQLMRSNYLPISIPTDRKLEYFDVLEEFAINKNLEPFMQLIMGLEERELDFYLKQIK